MSDENENKPTLTRKPLGLKRSVESGEVKQTFSHGRTNKVVVEVKRRKLVGKPGYEAEPEAPPPPPVAAAPVAAPAPPPPVVRKEPTANDMLSRQERQTKLLREAEEARLGMLEESRRRETEQRLKVAEDERNRAAGNREAEKEAAEEAAAEAAVPAPVVSEVASEPAEASGTEASPATPSATSPATPVPSPRRFTPVEAPKRPEREEVKKAPQRPNPKDRNDRRQSGKLTVTRALDDNEGARARSLAALKRAREKEKRMQGGGGRRQAQPKKSREVIVPELITVQELANRMAEKGKDLVKALFNMDMPVTLTETIDQDTAELLIEEFGHTIIRVSEGDVDIKHDEDVAQDDPATLKPRPPVVAVMGHVDHGKTSLLDALRGANVVSGEAGGITQHIGAYQVATDKGVITFLDTPGHEAFTQMRQRGASVTDIVILVVAADDGLMPQTIEAIKHCRAANVPMIIAINKMDKEGANPQKVRERLLEHEVVVEAMGGEVQDVEVSALKKTGLDTLLEKLLLQAEVMELSANPDCDAEGVVVEAQLDKGRGAVATVLIKRGTLQRGDVFVVGAESGKVRAIVDDKGAQIKKATPGMPVEVLGLSGVPSAGDILTVVENESRAREVALYRKEQSTKARTTQVAPDLENLFSNMGKDKAMEYPVVIKADVQGSAEAIVTALNNLSTDLIKVRVLLSGVGGITESDMLLAASSNAPLIGFNVRPNTKAAALAKRDGVRLKYFDVIYHLTADIAKEMAGELGPEIIETVVGRAEVKDVFKSGKRDKAAGLLVTEGIIKKGLNTRLTRDDVIISATKIGSLRRFKDDVDEVRAGMECGAVLEDTNDVKAGDMLEIFEIEERERVL